MDRKERLKKVFRIGEAEALTSTERDNLLKNILRDVQMQRRSKRIRRYATAAAAAAAILVLSLTFYLSGIDQLQPPMDLADIAKTNESRFSDHEHIQLAATDQNTKAFAVHRIKADQDILHQLAQAPAHLPGSGAAAVQYATIYIPYGKRQEFRLPDGSTVWLNAGSYLTFAREPSGERREVYLNGEGYFDVKHTGAPFIVKTKHGNVQVLGTTFNLSAYEDDEHTTVDLITGKVVFESNRDLFEPITMAPGERIDYNSLRANIHIDKKSAGMDILWTQKQLAFENVPFAVLMRKLERAYNVKIDADKSLYHSSVEYSGRLNIDVDVISSLKNIYELRGYSFSIDKKEVKITRK